MPIEILMPALSPTMTEGNLAKWVKKEGEKVEPGEVIAEIETDKATMEVEAVDEGIIGKIVIPEGTEAVPVNKLIALLLEEGEDKAAVENYKPANDDSAPAKEESGGEAKSEGGKAEAKPAAAAAAKAPTTAAPAPSKAPAPSGGSKGPKLASGAGIAPAAALGADGERVKASPVARKLAAAQGVDITRIMGTGPRGRVVKEDVESYIAHGGSGGGMVRRNPVDLEHVPHNQMRKVIAKRLVESKQQVPHFYLTIDCSLDKLLEARQDLNNAARLDEAGQPTYKVSVNDMIIKAVALSMRDVPESNMSWYDDAAVRYTNVDVSVAVATDGGLITPIIFNADQKTLPQISGEMKELARRARGEGLRPEEFQGGGFSISNLGMFGIKEFAAIVNPPQACILAVGAGEKRAVVQADGSIAAETQMTVTLSVDHRIVDGAVGANFLAAFKTYIESPLRMFI